MSQSSNCQQHHPYRGPQLSQALSDKLFPTARDPKNGTPKSTQPRQNIVTIKQQVLSCMDQRAKKKKDSQLIKSIKKGSRKEHIPCSSSALLKGKDASKAVNSYNPNLLQKQSLGKQKQKKDQKRIQLNCKAGNSSQGNDNPYSSANAPYMTNPKRSMFASVQNDTRSSIVTDIKSTDIPRKSMASGQEKLSITSNRVLSPSSLSKDEQYQQATKHLSHHLNPFAHESQPIREK